MLIWGSAGETKDLGVVETRRCDTCEKDRPFKLFLQYRYSHIWYLFSWISAKKYLLLCDVCHRGVELDSGKVESKLEKNPIPFRRRYGWTFLVGLIALGGRRPLRFLGLLVIPLLALLSVSCGNPGRQWEPGALYSVSGGDGTFRVVKVLALDPGAVSVRVYKQKFTSRPQHVNPAGLTLGSIKDKDGFGIGHIPLTERDFRLSFPVFLSRQGVSEEELDGYKYWKESGGGAFSSSSSGGKHER